MFFIRALARLLKLYVYKCAYPYCDLQKKKKENENVLDIELNY
jgi:hypothetical protein